MKKWPFLVVVLIGCATDFVPPPSALSAADYNEILPNGAPVTALYIGSGSRCSATRVDARIYLTAKHCLDAVGGNGFLIDQGGQAQDISGIDDAWASNVTDIAVLLAKDVLPADISWTRFAVESYRGSGYLEGFGCESALHTYQRQLRFGFVSGHDSGYLGVYGKVCGGDSGGALMNDSGDLMGIIVSSMRLSTITVLTAAEVSQADSGLKQMLARELAQNGLK